MTKSLAYVLKGLILIGSLQTATALATQTQQPILVKQTHQVDIYEARELYIVKVLDPYADVNRVISDFNANVYQIVKKPATFYSTSPLMIPIRWPLKAAANVLSNVEELAIGTTTNILIGQVGDAGSSLARSLLNMLALGGMFDVATTLSETPVSDPSALAKMDTIDSITNSIRSEVNVLKKPKVASFDDVFRVWGFGCGVYLVFPLVGPGTGRELVGKVTEMPLQPETYVQPIILVRVASSIHNALEEVNRAKPFLQDYNLSTKQGKEQYYNLLRTAILNQNQCVDDANVKTEAEKEGLQVTDED